MHVLKYYIEWTVPKSQHYITIHIIFYKRINVADLSLWFSYYTL